MNHRLHPWDAETEMPEERPMDAKIPNGAGEDSRRCVGKRGVAVVDIRHETILLLRLKLKSSKQNSQIRKTMK